MHTTIYVPRGFGFELCPFGGMTMVMMVMMMMICVLTYLVAMCQLYLSTIMTTTSFLCSVDERIYGQENDRARHTAVVEGN